LSVHPEGSGLLPHDEPGRKPSWLKVRLPTSPSFFSVAETIVRGGLHTICRSARCPNRTECWSEKTAAFLILGDICTRQCAFCAVAKGNPLPPSAEEPARVAEAARAFGLDYVVVTSVTRDDLPDGGAAHFAAVLRELRRLLPAIKAEALVPDFQGDGAALDLVLAAGPDVLNHNLETPEAVYPRINRPRASYRRSLGVLDRAGQAGFVTKSGLMLGLGESEDDLDRTLEDLRRVGCRLLTLGQYLRPGRDRAAVSRYYSPDEFGRWEARARALGFEAVESGPLVRSSYHAQRMHGGRSAAGQDGPCAT
jgi:lipoic acid synthetase